MARDGKERSLPNPIHVQRYLGGMDYPVDKQRIVDQARHKGADDELLNALEQLPERRYDSPISVSREIGRLGH